MKRQRLKAEQNVGLRHGRLIIESVKYAEKNGRQYMKADCLCDCGNRKAIWLESLRRGTTRSCGCLHRESLMTRNLKHGKTPRKMVKKEYRTWTGMMDRCRNPKTPAYKRYGGRGIKVCERWHKFENFLADMGEPPSKDHTIERKDNDGDYCPENCCWLPRRLQSKNTRNVKRYTYKGVTRIQSDWAVYFGVGPSTMCCLIGRVGQEQAFRILESTAMGDIPAAFGGVGRRALQDLSDRLTAADDAPWTPASRWLPSDALLYLA